MGNGSEDFRSLLVGEILQILVAQTLVCGVENGSASLRASITCLASMSDSAIQGIQIMLQPVRR